MQWLAHYAVFIRLSPRAAILTSAGQAAHVAAPEVINDLLVIWLQQPGTDYVST